MFWSQRGYRYRPPLVIEKQISESLPVFEKHIKHLTQDYGIPLTVVNLVDQTGRELCLAENLLKVKYTSNPEKLSFYDQSGGKKYKKSLNSHGMLNIGNADLDKRPLYK